MVRKWRGFHDDECMLGSYLRGEKTITKIQERTWLFTRSHTNWENAN